MITLGAKINTENLAPSQHMGLNFNSACVFNGKTLFAGISGIVINEGDDDLGVAIDAYFQIPSASGDTLRQKRFRKLHVIGYFDGKVAITNIANESTGTTVTTNSMPPTYQEVEVPLNYTDSGEIVAFKFANVDGSDFSFDLIQAVVELTVAKMKATYTIGRGKYTFPSLMVSASAS
jgi:hypothetical protein